MHACTVMHARPTFPHACMHRHARNTHLPPCMHRHVCKAHLPPCMHAPSCTQDPPAGHACRPARKKICRSCRRIHLRIPLHRIWDSQPAWMCHVRPKCREAVAAHIPKVSDPQESPLQSFTQTSLQSVMSWWQCSVQHRASESNQER